MVRNEEKYQNARDFRKRGFSYAEIAKIVGVSKSTVSLWFSKEAFSKRVKKDNEIKARKDNVRRVSLVNKARKIEREKHYKEALRSADTEFKNYRSSPLFMAGLMLYAGEGDNKHSRLIRLANSKVELHSVFIKFVVDFLGIPRKDIKFWLLLYPDLSESECKKIWSKSLKLKDHQFYKTQVIVGRSTKRTLHIGVGNTIIGSTILKKKLMRWIELASKELLK